MPDYDAQLYALVHRGTPGDKAFYARACHGADRVLELGCGYGRLMPTLVSGGARYRGLDIDADLLRLARAARLTLPVDARSRVRLSLGDMRSFQFRERFQRILLPHSTLYCLGPRDVLRCLRCVRAHLTATGELVLDAYGADAFHERADPATMTGRERDWITEVEHQGGRYRVFERTCWQPAQQRLTVAYEYESDTGERKRGLIRHRYLLAAQLSALLARAGLKVLEMSGGFARQRYGKRSEQLVVRAGPA